jgi:aerobic carbon-monoxide dehydrogenase large subunit
MDRDQAGVLGRRVLRVEDERLLTVGGTYVDDVQVPELTRAARVTFVRSPCAHALITGIDVSAALVKPGVVAVLTAADAGGLPASGTIRWPSRCPDRTRRPGRGPWRRWASMGP